MQHKTRTQAGVRDQGMYKNLYQQINMSGPGMDDMASRAAPGASMATQARAAGYQDIYRDIQAMRDAEYKKEVARGEVTKEFSGLSGSHTVGTQTGVRSQGLYKHLYPRTTPVSHPYLPRTVSSPGRKSGLGSYLGQAAEKTAPGLVVALGILIVYLLFIRKKDDVSSAAAGEEDEAPEEVVVEEEFAPSSRYHF